MSSGALFVPLKFQTHCMFYKYQSKETFHLSKSIEQAPFDCSKSVLVTFLGYMGR